VIALLGGEGGLRVGEIVALEWSDIDLKRRQIARLKARVHCDDEVVSRAEVPCLNQSHIASRFQLPRNPLRPSAIVLVVADEEICLRTCLRCGRGFPPGNRLHAADESASERAHESARRKIGDRDKFRLDDFRWSTRLPRTLKLGSRVPICTTRRNAVTEIAAPARLLESKRYRSSRGASRAIVVVEIRKHLREKSLIIRVFVTR
jgi:integrase